MSNKVANLLLSIAATDKEISTMEAEKNRLTSQRSSMQSEIEKRRENLTALDAHFRQEAQRQALEEHRLKDEETRIVERRKQLSAIGGAKAAKLMEREIDIASRSLEVMGERVQRAGQEADHLSAQVADAKAMLDDLLSSYEKESPQFEERIETLGKQLTSLVKSRADVLKKLEPRLQNLYTRVQNRYPADAIASVKGAACRSCFRALPPQVYNQLLAGNMLIQCPGCARILVFTGADE